MRAHRQSVDARSDLYGMGAVLFQLTLVVHGSATLLPEEDPGLAV